MLFLFISFFSTFFFVLFCILKKLLALKMTFCVGVYFFFNNFFFFFCFWVYWCSIWFRNHFIIWTNVLWLNILFYCLCRKTKENIYEATIDLSDKHWNWIWFNFFLFQWISDWKLETIRKGKKEKENDHHSSNKLFVKNGNII